MLSSIAVAIMATTHHHRRVVLPAGGKVSFFETLSKPHAFPFRQLGFKLPCEPYSI
jgi:hypothetical protein